jgi:ubiquinone biosynthesis protein
MTTVAASVFTELGDDLWLLVPAFVFALVAGALVGRVLGVRRSVAATLATGILGWALGAAVAIVLAAQAEAGLEHFARNLFLFSLFGTMAAAVWIEFLARPGMIARAQTGLQSIPHPVRSMRLRSRQVRRYAEISRIAVRNGLGPSIGLGRGNGSAARGERRPTARRLRFALEECGGMFVKLGQVVSTRSDLISPDVAAELSLLQDDVRAAPREHVEELLDDELGAPSSEVFASFDWHPLAAASIGQVYRAQLHDGSSVVVKVQRPGVGDTVEVDLSVLEELGTVAETRTSWGSEYRVRELIDEFGARLREELDYRIEARNAHTIGACLPPGSRVYVPRVHEELSTSRVLVMEWLDGVDVRQVAWDEARPADRVKIADQLLRTFLEQMLQEGVFHADPHPGNVMLLADGRLALIDFGAAGRLDALQQAALRDMLAALTRRDADGVVQAVLQVARLRRGVDIADFERALARFMAQHLAPGSRPDAAMLNAMLRLFFDFGITLPAEWSTFFRALVVLEGTLTTIAPSYSVIDAAESIAGQWVRSQITPGSVQQAVRDEVLRTVPMLRRLPRHVDRAFSMLEREGLRVRVSHFADEHDERVVTKLVNRLALAFLAGTIAIGSVGLIAIEGGPAFSSDTSLLRVLGYFGLFCATVLAMRVIVSALRDGSG